MSHFRVHTKSSAPEQSAVLLAGAEKAYGFVPNLLGVLAESPAALNAYISAGQIFDQSSLSPQERQIVILSASRFNNCGYCVAAHSVIAGMQKVPAAVVQGIREDRELDDHRLEALRVFTTCVVEKRGWVSSEDIQNFLDAGYSRTQILEVIQGVSFKTLSNYVNHIAATPLDDAFVSQQWVSPDKQQAA